MTIPRWEVAKVTGFMASAPLAGVRQPPARRNRACALRWRIIFGVRLH